MTAKTGKGYNLSAVVGDSIRMGPTCGKRTAIAALSVGIIAWLFFIPSLVNFLPKHSASYFIIEHMDNLYSLNPAQIVVYSTQYCSDCLRAKAFFEANKIAYIPVSLEGNPDATEFVMKMNNGYRSVPTIIFPDGTVLVEPSWQELKDKVMK